MMIQPEAGKAQWIDAALIQYEAPLLRYAARLLGDLERARDVVQDTFLRLCREEPERLNGRLPQWLFTVCRNRALDMRRREGRMRHLDEDALLEHPCPEPTPARAVELRDSLRAVLDLVATLPAAQQEVLRLKFQAGLRYQEIAAITGLSVSHVGVLVHNGVKAVRARWQRRDPGAESSR